MALDFMMPPMQGNPNELPPAMAPAAPAPMEIPPQVAPSAGPDPIAQTVQAAQPQVAKEEGMAGEGAGGVGFFDKLRTDPKLSQAMMMVGLRMMQGQRQGQDAMGMISDAMMAGATAHNMLSHNEKQQAQQEQEFGLKKEEAGVRMDAARAQTAATTQATEFKAQLQPEELKEAKLRIVKMKAEGDLAGAKAMGAAILNDPETVRQQLKDEHTQRMASANASNASAGASSAAAESSRTSTKGKKQEQLMKEWAVSGTPEQKKQARDYFTVDDPSARTSAGKTAQVEELIKRANPDYTDAQVASAALDLSSSQKGERIIALKALVDNGSDAQRTAALEELNGIVLSHKKPGSGVPSTGGTPVQIKNEAEWKALKPGTPYTMADGRRGIR